MGGSIVVDGPSIVLDDASIVDGSPPEDGGPKAADREGVTVGGGRFAVIYERFR